VAARFASNLIVLITGAFLAAATFAFPLGVIGWLGLAAGCVIAATVLAGFATSGRGIFQRSVDCLLAVLAAWTIVASRGFDGETLRWLMFASGVTAALLAVQGLIAHEVVMELSLRRAGESDTAQARAALPADQPPAIRVAG
jgi:hypothetical protein